MAKIVSGAATSHTFGLPGNAADAAQRIADGMLEIGRRVRASKPDLLLIVSSDHLTNFNLDFQIPWAVGLADSYLPLGDLGTRRVAYRGHREFATGLMHFAAAAGFDLIGVERLTPDHGITVPNEMINGDAGIPIVPIYINTVMQPIPTCARSFGLGRIIADYVASIDDTTRVAIVATGGLSHWVCMPDSGRVNAEWDRSIIELVISGQGERLAQWTPDQITGQGGNGGLEIATWACMAGALRNARGEAIYYEAMTPWWTGMGGIFMTPQS
ncbi:protocatechuate 4,5-dioxygenase beta chain/2'-aminobiphenyl-2,3-diol 1,2-dioxygenase large subunit [Variovorax boronicumulans]|uniref:DODA-type extradiol aromatic ring-opening family dioxygenase n=1 Tax=Variovorax boronicumulans TaxID=436515 RepID=UPI002788BFEF|nr:hypothetical protein [Variovorax boronicumulans]MDP9919014.1 protocatechuate 4,5-dioxygenase beta chain/2'-aminobiphenyl-2,3-diol 1,2-dioxygenase large subunit [Variovorax boronicumulans]